MSSAGSGLVDASAWAALQQFDDALWSLFGIIEAVDAVYRNSDLSVVERSYEAFFLQIPEMKLQVITADIQQPFEFEIAETGVIYVLPAFDVEDRHQPVLNIDIAFDAFGVACFPGQDPVHLRTVLMLNIVLGASDRVFQGIVGFDDLVEAIDVTGSLIVRMEAPRMMAKDAFDRFLVCVGADFQDFVIVDESSVSQDLGPRQKSRIGQS
jgi:hypothetical protein